MTPEIQREAMTVLADLWALSPDVRLGRLMAHLGFLGEAHLDRGLGDLDDDELIAVLYRHRAELLARSQADPRWIDVPMSASGSPTLADTADPP